jgi:hypothetical protein
LSKAPCEGVSRSAWCGLIRSRLPSVSSLLDLGLLLVDVVTCQPFQLGVFVRKCLSLNCTPTQGERKEKSCLSPFPISRR